MTQEPAPRKAPPPAGDAAASPAAAPRAAPAGGAPAAPRDDGGTAPQHPDPLRRLLAVMARLRDPDTGCPWDVQQDFASIAPYTIEEAYEVVDAITRGDMDDLKAELGDLLLQVVFHSRMAQEAGLFDFDDVARGIGDKMIARHPHVFGSADPNRSAADQPRDWERIKAEERRAQGRDGVFDGVALGLPALLRAVKLQKRAARVGFDWPEPGPVVDKIAEEAAELAAAARQDDRDAIEDELGDLLFALANLARHLGLDPEAALRRTNAKFERRFRRIEAELAARGERIEDASLARMEALWQAAKRDEPGRGADGD